MGTSSTVQHNIPYAKLGFWRIGGPLAALHTIHTQEELTSLLCADVPIHILGNGSNMLVADEGISGNSVLLKGEFEEYRCLSQEGMLILGAGLKNVVVLNRLKKQGCFGLSALAGVPGTIGGAIRMNAGSVLGEIAETVLWVEWMDAQGVLHKTLGTDCGFSYRKASNLPAHAIIVRAAFRIQTEGFAQENLRIAHHLERRKATQPLDLPSCGSVFKNPPNEYAGRLIERVGLKGYIIGGAAISSKHANFIVNQEEATALDVFSLISLAQERVLDATGILLEPEVRLKGDWPEECQLQGIQ